MVTSKKIQSLLTVTTWKTQAYTPLPRITKISSLLFICLLVTPTLLASSVTEQRANGLIAFTSERDGNREIYTMKPDGTLQTRLTANANNDEYPGWSPDGTKIVFASDRDGNYEIYVMNADGSSQTRLTNNIANDHYASWSPDGTKITFGSNRDGNWQIYVMNTDGSAQTRLTNNNAWDSGAKWSPDGAKIAFSSNRDGNWEIYVMNPDGSGQTRLTNNQYSDGECFWSPDGRVAYVTEREGYAKNYIVNVDGSGETKVVNNDAVEGGDGSWSPDGTKIAFNKNLGGNWEIYTTNVDGSGQKNLTNNQANDYWPAWQSRTPQISEPKVNGKIVFMSDRDGNWEIYAMNRDGSAQTRLTNNNYNDGHPCWSPDGNKIAFHSNRDGNFEIYVMNADGSSQTRLTNNNADDGEPSWSPDGTTISFASNRDGNYEVYVMNPNGTGQTRLTYNIASDLESNWSPDSTKIIFTSNRDGDYRIYVMDSDGSAQRRLTNNISGGGPNWSPDGAKIAFHTEIDGNNEIYVMSVGGTGETRFTRNSIDDEHPYWSPDGTKIAYASKPDGNIYEIYIMNADGSAQTRLTNNNFNDASPSWQSLPLQTATLILQSSTTDTRVSTSFNLNATLSAPRTGPITLLWSIDNSGFIYTYNATMTNGKYGRSFGAGTPGTWTFKAVWAGDNEYKGAESNTVTVTVKPPPVIAASATANPTIIYSGGSSKIRVALTSEGSAVKGATITLASSSGGTFSAITDQGNGTYTATYTAPDVTAQASPTVIVTAKKNGYQDTSTQIQLTIQTLALTITVKHSDNTLVTGATVTSTSQPSGQTALSGTTDANGKVNFSNLQKGTYTFKASKSGYDDKTSNINIAPGQISAETITITKQSGGIPGYPTTSIALALILSIIILYRPALRPRSK